MLNSRKILIVDDDGEVAALMDRFVQKMGHDSRIAGSGEEAMKVFPDYLPDAVILDVIMPRMDGVEFLRWLGENFPKRTAILIVSGHTGQYMDSLQKLGEGLGAGRCGFLPKPMRFENFREALDELLAG